MGFTIADGLCWRAGDAAFAENSKENRSIDIGGEAPYRAPIELWVPDGQHYVDARAVRGHEALESRVRESHEKNVRDGGNQFRSVQDARQLRDVVTFHWEMLRGDSEMVEGRGREFLIVNDEGRILADYMFYSA